MKKILLYFMGFIFSIGHLFAQSPEAFQYQAIARSSGGEPLVNRPVNIQIQILETSVYGPSVYVERHDTVTNQYGLFTLAIGTGAPELGTFSEIEWGSNQYYLEVAIDANGGNNFIQMGIAQLLSVPYALHAKTADYNKLQNTPELFDGDYYSLNNLPELFSGVYSDLTELPNIVDSIELYSFNGNYNHLTELPNIVDSIELHGFSGNYNDLINKPSVVTGSNILIGMRAGENTTGYGNTVIGTNALIENKTGNNNTAVGRYAGPPEPYYYPGTIFGNPGYWVYYDNLVNTCAIGYNAKVYSSNTVKIGNTSITEIGGYASWSDLSDGRFKTNITSDVPGLEFINLLKPVTFKWDLHKLDKFLGISNSDYVKNPAMEGARLKKEAKVYSGFIAQEVEEAAKAIGYDFSAILKPENGRSHYNLAYSEFVVPLVKAVQEQQKMIEEQQKLIKELQKDILELKSMTSSN